MAVSIEACHCEKQSDVGLKGMPVVQSPGTMLIFAVQYDALYQEIATSGATLQPSSQ